MVNGEQEERIFVSLDADVATVCVPNGAEVLLPTEILNRSSVLQQAISQANGDSEEVPISLPQGTFDAWLDGLKAAGFAVGVPQLPHKPPKHSIKHDNALFEGLKVCLCRIYELVLHGAHCCWQQLPCASICKR